VKNLLKSLLLLSCMSALFVSHANAACTISFQASSINGLTVTFVNNSTTTSGFPQRMSYYWSFGDGTFSTAKNPVKTYATSGWKAIQLTINDSAGCIKTKNDTVSVHAPQNQCEASFTTLVSGLTLTFSNNSKSTNGSNATLSYLWNFGDGTTSNLQTPIKTYASGGLKIVKLSISDSSQNCFASYTDTLSLTAPVSFCAAKFTKSISGLTVAFSNNSTNTNGSTVGLSYLWNFGDGTTSLLKNPTKTFATAGTKIVKLNIIDSLQGCWSSKTDSFLVNNIPPICQASFNLAIDTVNAFNFYILNTSIVRPGTFYLWSFGDGDSSNSVNPTHTYASFGKYNICLKIIDSLCTSTFCDSLGMDSSGILLKSGAFGFTVLDLTKPSVASGVNNLASTIENLKIYPNPSRSNTTISWTHTKTETVTLKLFDLAGNEIQSKTLISNSGENVETIDLSNLANSIYFLQYHSESNNQVYKLIKN
jgi:PKD repeat protein